jgi:serine/threonine protein kinase
LKFDSDFAELSTYEVDISIFEEESVEGVSCGISGEIYRRQDDDCLIVMKSKNISDSVENREIAKAIAKEVNVLHPCISAPIGFVLPVESSELRELKIVGLFVEGCSLAEVVLANPVWWTPTVKAKAVAGIALGLRFIHSFGLIHGNLNSNNIVFDEAHRIQITNFCDMKLEVGESEGESEGEGVRGSDVGGLFDEGWTAQANIDGFGSLLFEIIVGHPLIVPGNANSEGTVNLKIPEFVSDIIEAIEWKDYERVNSFNYMIDILKGNAFKIESDVDSEEVFEFVRWIELWEKSI